MPYKLNPFTGNLDLVNDSGSVNDFEFIKDYYSSSIIVPLYRQLLVYSRLTIDETLTIDGTVAII